MATFPHIDELLSETPANAAQRARHRLQLEQGAPLALYGAGTLGRTVLHRLRTAGIEPVAFADDTPEKEGTSLEGVPIMGPGLVLDRFGKDVLFVVTILNPQLRFLDARNRLYARGASRVVSFLEVAWKYPDSFLPYYQFELPQNVLAKREPILKAWDRLADEESRTQLASQLRFRLHLDYEALPVNRRDDYFPPDLLPRLPGEVTFVDCGAFDGDSIRRFLEQQQGEFDKVYAFEPDRRNCAALRRYVDSLPPQLARRIHVVQAAVGDRHGKLSFQETGNMGAAVSTSGNVEVDVVPIQEIVPFQGGPIYLKFDVEGAEWEALRGCELLIRNARPTMAISIYHQPDDLWELPLWIDRLGLGYEIYIRTQGEDGMDVICYALRRDH